MPAQDLALLLTLSALWGGSFVFMRVAAPALGPLWLADSRVALAFVALALLARTRGPLPAWRARWRNYLFVGTVNSALPFALFCFAELYVSASTAAILNATSPFFGAIVAAVWIGEALTPRKLAGMVVGMAGVVLLVGWHPEPLTTTTWLAFAACLAAALCYGIAGVYTKKEMADVPSFSIALYSQLAAALVLAPVLPFTVPAALPTPLVIANIVALALLSTAVAYLIYFRLIARQGATRALTVTFLIPLFGIVWGHLFLGEPLTANAMAGCALVLIGTWIATRAGRAVALPAPRG